MKSLQKFERMLQPGKTITISNSGIDVTLTLLMHAEQGPFNAVMDMWANDDCSIQLSHTVFEHRLRQFRYVMMFSKHGRIPEDVGSVLIDIFLPDELMIEGAYIDTLDDMPPALVLSNFASNIRPGTVRPGID